MPLKSLVRIVTVLLVATGLAACAPSLQHQVNQQDKSVVFFGVEVIPDYEPGIFADRPQSFYSMSVVIGGGEQKQSSPISRTFSDDDDNRIWVAMAIDPGTYQLRGLIERGKTGELFVRDNRKTTDFSRLPRPLLFEVGRDEIVYVGTFKSRIASRPDFLSARLLNNATKSFQMETERARAASSKLPASSATFRAVDLLSNNPDALRAVSVDWDRRPWD